MTEPLWIEPRCGRCGRDISREAVEGRPVWIVAGRPVVHCEACTAILAQRGHSSEEPPEGEALEFFEKGPAVYVRSWSPSGSAPATQVHLSFGKPPGRTTVIRFKSASALDELLRVLREHREYVWGKTHDA